MYTLFIYLKMFLSWTGFIIFSGTWCISSGSLSRDQRRENETGTLVRALQSPELKQRETDFLWAQHSAVRGSSHRWAGPGAGCWCFSLLTIEHGAVPGWCTGRCDAGVRSPGWARHRPETRGEIPCLERCLSLSTGPASHRCRRADRALPPVESTQASESVVSRIIGENSQISRQQISSSSYYNLVKWWVKHSRYLSLEHEYFLGCLECIFWCDHYPLECHLSCQVSSLCSLSSLSSRLTPGSHSSPLVFRDLMPKMPRALATWHLLQQSQGASSVESHCVERTAVSIFPETIKLWDNQNRVYAAPAEMFWHSRHPQILRFWWVLWCKFYQFSNDLIDLKAWVVIELQISTGNFGFTDPLLLYESS